MKMSEEFNLPLEAHGDQVIIDSKGNYVGTEIYAIAHAINCHDDLVEALGLCVNSLNNLYGKQVLSVGESIGLMRGEEALAKARGEA